jgi:HD-GYP domain-containing protein (c-di-GMP phosphodiesterase class II)
MVTLRPAACNPFGEQMSLLAGLGAEQAVFALAAAAEAKDTYPKSHTLRVANIALHLGVRLGLQECDLVALYRGGLIHDIGKLGVAEAILLKAGPLNAEEERQMRAHPVIGESTVQLLASAADTLTIIRHHHERFDGGGYPDGLAGHKIPLLARIASVYGAYGALASDRPYRARRTADEVHDTLMRGAGQQWDRELVSLLLSEIPVVSFRGRQLT